MTQGDVRDNPFGLLVVFGLWLCLLPRLATAQEPTLFAGNLSLSLGVDTQTEDPLEDMADLRSRVDLDLRHPLGDGVRTRLAARLWHRALVGHEGDYEPAFTEDWPAFGTRHDSAAELREAYLQWHRPWGTLILGQDLVQWGALELQSPFRILNAMDYRSGLTGAMSEDSLAIPELMLRFQRKVGEDGALDLVYLPFFSQHRFSPFGTDTAIVRPGLGPQQPLAMVSMLRRADLRLDRTLAEVLVNALEPPPAAPWAGSLGARYGLRLGDWDLAGVAIWNWDRLPELAFDADIATVLGAFTGAGFDQGKQVAAFTRPDVLAASERLNGSGKTLADLVQATWRRRVVLGVEATVSPAEGWILRSDAAFSPSQVFIDQALAPFRSPLVQAGAGAEYAHEDWLVALVEWSWQYVLDVPAGRKPFLLARHHHVLGGGLRAMLGEGQPWTLQLGGMWGVSLGDWAVAPEVGYAMAENWTAAVGATLSGGPVDSPGGLTAQDDQGVVRVRRAF